MNETSERAEWSLSIDDSIATIRFDDGKANALTVDALAELNRMLDAVEEDARAIVLCGRPGFFSAGFDLTVVRAKGLALDELLAMGARTFARLLVYPRPVVAACSGHALAAAGLVLLACDVRIGTAGPFRIGLNEVAIGSPLPQFLIELARYRMPPSALDSILWGETVEPERAVQLGFLDDVVPADAIELRCAAEARRLAELPRKTVAGAKRAVRADVARRMLAHLDSDLSLLNPTFEDRRPTPHAGGADGVQRRRRAHGHFAEPLYAALGELDPDMQRWSDEFIFGDVWGRPGLCHDDRLLVVIVALAATGKSEQLRYYIAGALEAGIAEDRIHESLILLSVYAGFPNSLGALAVLKKVLSDQAAHGNAT